MTDEKLDCAENDSSMSTADGQLCSDTECVGQLTGGLAEKKVEGEPETKKKSQDNGRAGTEAESSMRAGSHRCVDDQCIGKT